jgi:hypothetical protein
MARPREGREVKQAVSVRLEPYIFLKIVKKFGSFTAFVKKAIEVLL